ncbi:hypothetical protein M2324_003841 [Rhodovulum sulfidophilum]|nr:hypothetical protein [Rhodovulum sulfidophilum]MCW2305417.1 hypothetical protein [Rhodovulum sulfidophilum]
MDHQMRRAVHGNLGRPHHQERRGRRRHAQHFHPDLPVPVELGQDRGPVRGNPAIGIDGDHHRHARIVVQEGADPGRGILALANRPVDMKGFGHSDT